ncbi:MULTISPECIES: DUF1289 domain-containing protein [unclassified Pseudomonas]|uniref:DUF1289 domain-containing protein n=1 Tax=unclassified Pseudomonas TaxID=196821 RepID=UPI000BCC46EC|nr:MULTISPECIES: DUF1289 domain-containing protein [unclassified Pseudomonas]PVZ16024.1 hypothetical protein F474_01526 [Pseudomonas sp. URIL14HWK12:I12]PVZ26120.1 hypothetical protein F470_01584 [Pseudomonas sp. URIL14HWK12:I10]PVZ36356.1 hypothetical protein F472_01526 [Pseudomonas sp. URIL14HWK12:I11]SNZ18418.1 hypothetical protein SAMN05660463_03990 [Pseudomonas sp. URIL14HWK12:I9]
MIETERERPVRSPCVSICALDEHDLCLGCQRTASEISGWGRMNNDERRQVLAQLAERARAQGLMQ